jgi:hypothetical protein
LEIGKKNFQFHPWPAEIFGKNQKMRFFGLVQSLILGALLDRSLPFFQHVLFMESLIHIPKYESKTVVTREWSRQGSKFISLQNLRSKFYLTKIFLKNSFWTHIPSTMF